MKPGYYIAKTGDPLDNTYLVRVGPNSDWVKIWWRERWCLQRMTKDGNRQHWRPIGSSRNLINFYKAIL